MTFVNPKRWCGAVVAVALASGCASLQPRGGTPSSAPDNIITIVLSDASGTCRKVAPTQGAPVVETGYTLAGAGQKMIWRVTNNCKQPIAVRIKDVDEKGSTFTSGFYPFKPGTIAKNIAVNATEDIEATTLDQASVPEKKRGAHVYRYKIELSPGGDEDPEIIVEWP